MPSIYYHDLSQIAIATCGTNKPFQLVGTSPFGYQNASRITQFNRLLSDCRYNRTGIQTSTNHIIHRPGFEKTTIHRNGYNTAYYDGSVAYVKCERNMAHNHAYDWGSWGMFDKTPNYMLCSISNSLTNLYCGEYKIRGVSLSYEPRPQPPDSYTPSTSNPDGGWDTGSSDKRQHGVYPHFIRAVGVAWGDYVE